MLHVDASEPGQQVGGEAMASGAEELDGVLELDGGAMRVSAETSRRLACDASVVRMLHTGDGTVLDVGRKTRTIPPAIRRALTARDCTCRFPGCTSRHCDSHHVVHWADGGSTSLDNLLLLCRRHHRAVHEGRFTAARHHDGSASFMRPDGSDVDVTPPIPCPHGLLAAASVQLADIPVWDGAPFDVVWAMDVLYARGRDPRETMPRGATGCA